MTIATLTIITFALSLTPYSFANPNVETYSLTIEVMNLRNAKGSAQFALYNKDGYSFAPIMDEEQNSITYQSKMNSDDNAIEEDL